MADTVHLCGCVFGGDPPPGEVVRATYLIDICGDEDCDYKDHQELINHPDFRIKNQTTQAAEMIQWAENAYQKVKTNLRGSIIQLDECKHNLTIEDLCKLPQQFLVKYILMPFNSQQRYDYFGTAFMALKKAHVLLADLNLLYERGSHVTWFIYAYDEIAACLQKTVRQQEYVETIMYNWLAGSYARSSYDPDLGRRELAVLNDIGFAGRCLLRQQLTPNVLLEATELVGPFQAQDDAESKTKTEIKTKPKTTRSAPRTYSAYKTANLPLRVSEYFPPIAPRTKFHARMQRIREARGVEKPRVVEDLVFGDRSHELNKYMAERRGQQPTLSGGIDPFTQLDHRARNNPDLLAKLAQPPAMRELTLDEINDVLDGIAHN